MNRCFDLDGTKSNELLFSMVVLDAPTPPAKALARISIVGYRDSCEVFD
jgi:hypothetical protein